MPNLVTTLFKIKTFDPCAEGWKRLLENTSNGIYVPEKPITLLDILESNGVEEAYWALRCWEYHDCCLLAADVAESVVSHWNDHFPGNSRLIKCIEGIRSYGRIEISTSELDRLNGNAWEAWRMTFSVKDLVFKARNAARASAFASAYAQGGALWHAAWHAQEISRRPPGSEDWKMNEALLRRFIEND